MACSVLIARSDDALRIRGSTLHHASQQPAEPAPPAGNMRRDECHEHTDRVRGRRGPQWNAIRDGFGTKFHGCSTRDGTSCQELVTGYSTIFGSLSRVSARRLMPSSIRRIMAKSPNSINTTPTRAAAGLCQS